MIQNVVLWNLSIKFNLELTFFDFQSFKLCNQTLKRSKNQFSDHVAFNLLFSCFDIVLKYRRRIILYENFLTNDYKITSIAFTDLKVHHPKYYEMFLHWNPLYLESNFHKINKLSSISSSAFFEFPKSL